jgi:hypothetical protein
MIALLDTSEDLDVCAGELGCATEQLFSPLTRFSDRYPERKKAADNGGFKGLNIPAPSYRPLKKESLRAKSERSSEK